MEKNGNCPNKRVLMLCYYFPPDMLVGSLRSRKYAQYLDCYGWHCRVLTSCFGRDKKMVFPETVKITVVYCPDFLRLLNLLKKVVFGLKLRIKRFLLKVWPGRVRKNEERTFAASGGMGIATTIQRWLLLPDPQFLWILTALPAALFKAYQCDVIYSSSSPCSAHVLGLLVKKLTHKPWLADYRDEWSLNCIWRPPTRFHKWLGEKLDKACVKNADMIINTTEVRTRMFIEHFGGPKEKFVTISNGYDEDDIAKFREIDPPKDVFVMTSLGSLYGGRDAKPFMRSVARLLNSGVIRRSELNIKVIGSLNPDLIKEVEKLEISDVVQIVPMIPQEDAFMALAKSHIAVLVGSGMEKVAMTTKVYEYAGMGKPILALVPQGPVHDFISKCGGWCVEGSDEEGISKAVTNIFVQYKSGKLKMHHVPGFVKHYERRNLTKELACCFDQCIK